MEDFELVGPNGTDVNNEFLKQYRDALKNQYDASLSSLKQQYRNNQASIMSAANEKGMMYSNFPQRSKIQAESDYLSNVGKLHSTYQTGLDKLRNNAVNAYNQIKAYEEAISDLNEKAAGGSSSSSSSSGSGSGGDGNTTTTTDKDPIKMNLGGNSNIDTSKFTSGESNSSNKNFLKDTIGYGDNIVGGLVGSAIGGMAGSLIAPVYGPLSGLLGQGIGSLWGSNWKK